MARPKPKCEVQQRMFAPFDVATRLGRSEQWLADNRARLESEGFPRLDPLIGLYDMAAVDRWLDVRSGLAPRSKVANDDAPPVANDVDPFLAACKR